MKRRKGNAIIPVREPNGRLSRSLEALLEAKTPGEVRRLRDAACARMAAPEWGTELGRLYLEGKIGPILFETGKRWTRLAAEYRSAVGAPPDASASRALFGVSPHAGQSDERQARRERKVVEATIEALAVLRTAGLSKERVVRAVCERDETPSCDSGLRDFRLGLAWLANHWGLLGS